MYALFDFTKCAGKYTATCKGDDSWIDANKTQKKGDFFWAKSPIRQFWCQQQAIFLNKALL